tara:strand:- start:966 stop:1799 length:834 start_codon:yes stop_codon:yes gene_type:complete
MRVLIIGGSGFIGYHTHNYLSKFKKFDLKTTYHISKKKNFIKYELGNPLPLSILKFKPQIIINTAWYGIPNFSFNYSYLNLINNIKFLKELDKLKSLKKIIVLGSCWELLDNESISEDIQYFIWAKKSINTYYNIFTKLNKISYNWVRIFYVYGSGQKKSSLIPSLVEKLKKNKKVKLNNPNATQDFVYIKDVTSVIKLLISNKDTFELNVGSGKLVKIKYIKDTIDSLISKKSINYKPEIKNTDNILIEEDMKILKQFFSFKPSYHIEDGLKDLLK